MLVQWVVNEDGAGELSSSMFVCNVPVQVITRAGASTRFTSTSTSTSTCNMCEYEYEYLIIAWVRVRVRVLLMSTSTSTGIWSTFYIKSSIAFFILWRGNPQILINLRQSYNFPLPMQIPFVNICLIILCNLEQWHFNSRFATYWLSWLIITTCCQFKNRKQKLRNIRKYVENSLFFKSEAKIFIH